MTKQKQIIDKAIELVNDWEIDKALDLIDANRELLEKPWFMNHYIKKAELKKYHILDGFFDCEKNDWVITEYQVDQLADEKWWKVDQIKGDEIYISKTGQDLIYDLKNLKAVKGVN